MKAIIFDTDTSKLQFDREIQLLKLSYLFADSLKVGGQVGANIMFERDNRKFSINKKLHYILNQVSTFDFPDTKQYIAYVEEFIRVNKKIENAVKNTKEVFTAYKKSSAEYTRWFEDLAIQIIIELQKSGITDMAKWVDDKVLEIAIPNMCEGADIGKKEARINAKELLDLLFPSNIKESSILVFPVDLIDNKYLTPAEKENLIEQEGVPLKGVNVYSCFKIPSIASLTSSELKALRGQLNGSFLEFREKVDEWVQFCKQNDEINSQVKRLKEEVIPCTIALEEILLNNQMLNSFENNVKLDTLDSMVYLGIAPVESIWKYYEEFNVLEKETFEIMKEIIASNESYPNFLPIICIVPSYRHLEKMEELEQLDRLEKLDMTRKKKSILVD